MSVVTRREQQRKLGLFTSILGFAITSTLFILGCIYLPIIIPSFMIMGVVVMVGLGAAAGGVLTWVMAQTWENTLLLATAIAGGAAFGLAFVSTALHVLPLMALTVMSLATAGGLVTAIGAAIFHIIGNSIFDRVTPQTADEQEDEELDTSLDPESDEVEVEYGQQHQQVQTLHTDSVTKRKEPSSTATIITISSAHSTPQTSMTSLTTAENSVSGSVPSVSRSLGSSSLSDNTTLDEELSLSEQDRPRPGLASKIS